MKIRQPNSITYKGKQVFRQALDWGKSNYPDAPQEKHEAFAASVLELVRYEITMNCLGPSCRAYAVSFAAAGDGEITHLPSGLFAVTPDGRMPTPGHWEFERACKFAEPFCYGELTALHIRCYKTQPCFDEAAEDLVILKKHS